MTRLPTVTSQNDSMRRSVGVSAGMHVLILLFLYFGLPSLMKPLPTPSNPVPFEIVDIADLTNTSVNPKPEEPKPPAPPPKPEEAKITPPPPPPPEPQKPPEPPKPQEVKPLEQMAEAITPLPKPAVKPKPPEIAKPKQDMLASVLKNVEKMKTVPPPVKSQDTKSQQKTQTQAQPQSQSPSLSERLSISEEDALRRQIEQCWNPPIGARDARSLVVDIKITVNQDRTVQSAEVVDKSRMSSDPFYRAAAEAALRAVNNPRCSPLQVPEGKYDQWKTIDFTFDPRDML